MPDLTILSFVTSPPSLGQLVNSRLVAASSQQLVVQQAKSGSLPDCKCCTLFAVHFSQYAVHCTLYTVHCTLYTVHCTLYIVQYTFSHA